MVCGTFYLDNFILWPLRIFIGKRLNWSEWGCGTRRNYVANDPVLGIIAGMLAGSCSPHMLSVPLVPQSVCVLPLATSREVSPQSRGGYVAHITGGYTAYAGATTPGAERRAIGRSRIPRSQGASREGSPSRQASDRAYTSIQRRSSGRSSMRANRSEFLIFRLHYEVWFNCVELQCWK